MASILLRTICPALLPHDDEFEYYDVMGLGATKKCDAAAIRKAYKQLSLKLHPDKVRQQQPQNPTTANIYPRIQEAYSVLSDPRQRKLYDDYGCSPAIYQFMTDQEYANPMKLHLNLIRASPGQKLRLVGVVLLSVLLILLQPVLIILNANHHESHSISIDWVLCLIPTFVLGAFTILLVGGVWKLYRLALEGICWLTGIVLLSLQLDETIDWSWHYVSIPFYSAIFVRIIGQLHSVSDLREIQGSMITPEYLERTEQHFDSIDDLPAALREKYVIVHENPDVVAAVLSTIEEHLPDEELEFLRVSSSPEFQETEDFIKQAQRTFYGTLLLFPQVALIALKVNGEIKDVSWWVIAVPLLVKVCLPLLYHWLFCCCVGSPLLEDSDDENDDHNLPNTSVDYQPPNGDIRISCPGVGSDNNLPATSVRFGDAEDDFPSVRSPVHDDTAQPDNAAPTTTTKEGEEATVGASTNHAAADSPTKESHTSHEEDEMFKRWQERYAQEEEHDVMEQKARSVAHCCWFSFQLILLCLIVGKLDDDDQDSYNGFWILFPIFFVSGVVLCCCLCCIYDRGGTEGGNNEERETTPEESANAEEGADSERMGDSSNSNQNGNDAAPNDVEAGGEVSGNNLDDLD